MLKDIEKPLSIIWIVDDNLLRDEGVIYGLSGSDYSDKLSTIELYYQEIIAIQSSEMFLKKEKKETSENIIQQAESCITKKRTEIEVLYTNPVEKSHTFYQALIRTLCYAAIIIFSSTMVYQWIRPHWQYPHLVTIGIYIFGGLSLYSKESILYSAQKDALASGRELWKIVLEEFGIPLVTTLFIIIWGIGDTPFWKTFVLGLLLFFMFLYSGKALLGSFSQLHQNFFILRSNWLGNIHRKRKIKSIQSDILEIEKIIARQQQSIEDLEKHIECLKIKIEILEQEKEFKKNSFLSEYYLAASYSERAETYKRQAHG